MMGQCCCIRARSVPTTGPFAFCQRDGAAQRQPQPPDTGRRRLRVAPSAAPERVAATAGPRADLAADSASRQ